MRTKNFIAGLVLASSLVLSACGGGGGGGGSSLPAALAPPAVPAASSFACLPLATNFGDLVMPAGLQIINDNGVVQIDENYKNLEFKGKYDVYIPDYNQTGYLNTPGYASEVVAIGDTGDDNVMLWSKTGAPGGYEYQLRKTNNGPRTIPVYVFGEPAAPAASGVGLQVFNGSGQLTYDSQRKYMKVWAQGQLPNNDRNAVYLSPWYNNQRLKIAVVLSMQRFDVYKTSQPGLIYLDTDAISNNWRPWFSTDMFGNGYFSDTSHVMITMNTVSKDWTPGNGAPVNQHCWIQPSGGQVLLVDVTGL